MNRKEYWWMLALAVLAGLVGGMALNWIFMGDPGFAQKQEEQAKVIRAQKFELVDKDGNVKASLDMSRDGSPGLLLNNHNSYVVLSASSKLGPSLILSIDEKFERSASVFVKNDGTPSLTLSDKFGDRFSVNIPPDGRAGMVFIDKSKKVRAGIALSQDGSPSINVQDSGELSFSDNRGKHRFRIVQSATIDDDPVLVLFDKYDKKRAALGLDKGRPILVFTDESEKVIWSAP